jgi:uncharacterized protein YceH (UPF0502 family)
MDIELTDVELRVLGVLIEKEVTTPDYYPMSLNALQTGCNQRSNRDPVMDLTEKVVLGAIDSLKEKRLAWQLSAAGARVPKFEHNLRSFFSLDDAEIAVLCTLMLRGPQTAGEIRTRAERMYAFKSLDEVVQKLNDLGGAETPLVRELPRLPGHKENRWTQLFCEQSVPSVEITPESGSSSQQTSAEKKSVMEQRIDALEHQLGDLHEELLSLRKAFDEFRSQF